ncbi:MAG: hypothetical protein NUV59_01160, partial [Patescibacteria group bacterium]|nr:hypothetical protein [Patescibacteria group bacterium]
SIEINQPSIIFIANPKTVPSGMTTILGWITTGMKSCVVSSPDSEEFTLLNVANTSPNGTSESLAIESQTTFVLSCTTNANQIKEASVVIGVAQ